LYYKNVILILKSQIYDLDSLFSAVVQHITFSFSVSVFIC